MRVTFPCKRQCFIDMVIGETELLESVHYSLDGSLSYATSPWIGERDFFESGEEGRDKIVGGARFFEELFLEVFYI